jgi:hypothetical protein
MRDANGHSIAVGDRVKILGNMTGVVVCSIDTGDGSPDCPIEQWQYLRYGIMVDTPEAGLVHITESADLRLLDR